MSASKEEINQTLRRLHSDFDLLLDNNVISSDLYDQLVEKIPRRMDPRPDSLPFFLDTLSFSLNSSLRSVCSAISCSIEDGKLI
jgi:hypothetical protein